MGTSSRAMEKMWNKVSRLENIKPHFQSLNACHEEERVLVNFLDNLFVVFYSIFYSIFNFFCFHIFDLFCFVFILFTMTDKINVCVHKHLFASDIQRVTGLENLTGVMGDFCRLYITISRKPRTGLSFRKRNHILRLIRP